jgi:SAM-dependent methyltransferase
VPNEYSQRWIDTFLRTQDPDQTAREIAFLQHQLPLPRYRQILDVCCGAGRHSVALRSLGYDVTGIDRDPTLIEVARAACPTGEFLAMDMRDLNRLMPRRFDAVICLWQSFGHFDSTANDAFLQQVSELLTADGRFILDIYHREFFEAHQGTRAFDRNGTKVTETKRVIDGRLHVQLRYEDGAGDQFDWELFTPADLSIRAGQAGFRIVSAISGFDPTVGASADTPRMQIVLEKHV